MRVPRGRAGGAGHAGKLGLQLADFPPGVKVVIRPLIAVDVNYFGQFAKQEHQRATNIHDVDGNVLAIEQ